MPCAPSRLVNCNFKKRKKKGHENNLQHKSEGEQLRSLLNSRRAYMAVVMGWRRSLSCHNEGPEGRQEASAEKLRLSGWDSGEALHWHLWQKRRTNTTIRKISVFLCSLPPGPSASGSYGSTGKETDFKVQLQSRVKMGVWKLTLSTLLICQIKWLIVWERRRILVTELGSWTF